MSAETEPLQHELSCPICLDWFHAAVETSCGHAFCCGCLLKVTAAADAAGTTYAHRPLPIAHRLGAPPIGTLGARSLV